jgi:sugar-specific transcriptional regulator TrmB
MEKKTTQNDSQLTSGKRIQTILDADDQVIIAKSEDELQMAANELNEIANKYNMKISSSKTTTGLCGKNIQTVKRETEDKIIEQVSNFNYLGHLISNEENALI